MVWVTQHFFLMLQIVNLSIATISEKKNDLYSGQESKKLVSLDHMSGYFSRNVSKPCLKWDLLGP